MKTWSSYLLVICLLAIQLSCRQEPKNKVTANQATDTTVQLAQTDPLPSWNESASKKAITDFVTKVTTQGNPDFVPVDERIACFDNDGTLWSEQPIYFQFVFAMDRVKQLAPQHP